MVGAGKSAAAMAAALEAAWPDVDLSGIVVTRHGHQVPTRRITCARRPTRCLTRRRRMPPNEILAAAKAAGPDDLVLALISGGGRR